MGLGCLNQGRIPVYGINPSLERLSLTVAFAFGVSLLKKTEVGDTTLQNGNPNRVLPEATSFSMAIRKYMEVVTGQAVSALSLFASSRLKSNSDQSVPLGTVFTMLAMS